jgi:hypothetical protein
MDDWYVLMQIVVEYRITFYLFRSSETGVVTSFTGLTLLFTVSSALYHLL